MTEEDIARVAHEAVRAYAYTLDDATTPAWDDAPDWMRVATIQNVRFVRTHNHRVPFDVHNAWLLRMTADGWKEGPLDPGARTHPRLVDYRSLPDEEKTKYYLFVSTVLVVDAG